VNLPDAQGPGLTQAEAARRLQRDGANVVPEASGRSRWRVLRDVVREPMLLLLLAATSLYVLLGDRLEASLLSASVLLVIALAAFQSERSERALSSLRELGAPRARVLRDGAWSRIPASELVVGDVFEIVGGDRVPADAMILSAIDLQVDESMLTGESIAVDKCSGADDERGKLQSATLAVRGSATAQVTAIGRETAVGRIGAVVQSIRVEPGPIQKDVRRLVRTFTALAAVACLAVVALHYLSHGELLAALLAGITLAIAIVPEEFPVVLAIFTALGALRLSRAQALARRLSTLETLGAVDVLCTDKTGTLTENRMRVVHLESAAGGQPADRMGELAAWSARSGSPDPMDIALVERFGGLPSPALREFPFSSAHPAVGQVLRLDGALTLACKGAPEYLARLCLDEAAQARWLEKTHDLAQQGLRVLAVAEARMAGDALPESLQEAGLQWRGLVAFADPLRPKAAQAVRDARTAGIRVLMLTGDHQSTATTIAREAGIAADEVLTGADLDAMDELRLREAVGRVCVFARVLPGHKLRLVQALRDHGSVVAMTGDGVNDAPALAAADVGIAMGGRGTDVARETAGLVLLDDDFATIVRAIRLGRQVRENLRRALRYIVSVHVPIAGMALLPLLLGVPAMLLPLHVVLLQLVIDPACSIVFEREPEAPDLMQRPPEGNRFHLFDPMDFRTALATGVAMFLMVAAVYLHALGVPRPAAQAAGLAFTTLLASNLALIWRYRGGRSLRESLQRPNGAFVAVLVAGTLLLAAATRIPQVAVWFAFQVAPLWDWTVAVLAPLPVAAAGKWLAGDRRAPGLASSH
jgi:Ca2+-transporting ATPase